MTDKFLHKNKWLSLKEISDKKTGIKGYVYSHETRCNGKIISILPYRIEDNGFEFLLRSEITPCWNLKKPILSSVTGGVEHVNSKRDAIRELLEETGYSIKGKELISLGTCRGSKSCDSIYYLYSVNLTEKIQGEALGDGGGTEAQGTSKWVSITRVALCDDPFAIVCLTRLLGIL